MGRAWITQTRAICVASTLSDSNSFCRVRQFDPHLSETRRMADALTKPNTEPDERNSLIPLPRDTPDADWVATAKAVEQLHRATHQFGPGFGKAGLLIDPDITAALLQSVADGLTPEQAAQSIGIMPRTVQKWFKRAQDEPNSSYALMATALNTARESRRKRLLQRIEKASESAPQHWTAAAWLLERGYGNDYKLAQANTAGQVIVNIGVYSPQDVRVGVVDSGDSASRNTASTFDIHANS